jgi:hypothetical protein
VSDRIISRPSSEAYRRNWPWAEKPKPDPYLTCVCGHDSSAHEYECGGYRPDCHECVCKAFYSIAAAVNEADHLVFQWRWHDITEYHVRAWDALGLDRSAEKARVAAMQPDSEGAGSRTEMREPGFYWVRLRGVVRRGLLAVLRRRRTTA